jgi:hypothetical protein
MPNILALAAWFFKRRYVFLSVAMATRVLLGIKFFEQFLRNISVKFG